jgi:hypothetical protein
MDVRERARVPQVGDRVFARDGEVGRVETVVRSDSKDPLYVVVAVRRRFGRRFGRRFPIAPWSLVTNVDRSRRRIHVRGCRRSVERLSETLPITV